MKPFSVTAKIPSPGVTVRAIPGPDRDGPNQPGSFTSAPIFLHLLTSDNDPDPRKWNAPGWFFEKWRHATEFRSTTIFFWTSHAERAG